MTEHLASVQAWLDTRADEMAELVTIDIQNPPGRGICGEMRRCAAV